MSAESNGIGRRPIFDQKTLVPASVLIGCILMAFSVGMAAKQILTRLERMEADRITRTDMLIWTWRLDIENRDLQPHGLKVPELPERRE